MHISANICWYYFHFLQVVSYYTYYSAPYTTPNIILQINPYLGQRVCNFFLNACDTFSRVALFPVFLHFPGKETWPQNIPAYFPSWVIPQIAFSSLPLPPHGSFPPYRHQPHYNNWISSETEELPPLLVFLLAQNTHMPSLCQVPWEAFYF